MATFDIFNLSKEKVGTVDLPDSVFAAEVNEHLFWEVVKSQLASRRAGTVAVKNRSLVRGGGKKPYKQKGTGRARQGSIRASHWVGGGKAMGPKQRDYAYRVPKKVRQGALRSALSLRAKEQMLFIVDAWAPEKPKTRTAAAILAKFGLPNVLVVDEAKNTALGKSLRNLPKAAFLAYEGFNVYDLLKHDALILTAGVAKSLGAKLSPEAA